MSSSVFATTLVLDPRRSRALTAAVALAWGIAGAAAITTLDHPLVALLLLLAVPVCWRDLRRLAPGPRLYWRGDGDWRLDDPEGPAWTLDGDSWSTPWLILLVLRGPAGCRRIALARDALDPVVWRRLRAGLRVIRVEAPARSRA